MKIELLSTAELERMRREIGVPATLEESIRHKGLSAQIEENERASNRVRFGSDYAKSDGGGRHKTW